MSPSKLEDLFAFQVRAVRVLPPVREHRFHLTRRWRFDFAWPDIKVAVEVEGGTWGGAGRHTRGSGFMADCQKYNAATLAGWRVLRGDRKMVETGELLTDVMSLITQVKSVALAPDTPRTAPAPPPTPAGTVTPRLKAPTPAGHARPIAAYGDWLRRGKRRSNTGGE